MGILRIILLICLILCIPKSVFAFSINLDSIASKSKFMNLGVMTYRFADRFFNQLDTVYVKTTGYKWNIKVRASSWTDFNGFYFDGNHQIGMLSPFCTSIGAEIQFMAIAIGYDININKLLGSKDRSKSRFSLEFSSSRFTGRYYSITNDDGMNIKFIDKKVIDKIPFSGVKSNTWGIDLTFYFNNGRYSNQAAFSFGKIQKISQGSFITGIAYQSQKLLFDFSLLSKESSSGAIKI